MDGLIIDSDCYVLFIQARIIEQRNPALEPLPLQDILSKCKKEEGLENDDQPLYVDWDHEVVKCGWCCHFKGSIEPRARKNC